MTWREGIMSTAEPERDLGDDLPQGPAMRPSPLHGFQGDRGAPAAGAVLPASLTIAVSREAGSRGSTIATRAGQKLGWQVYNQELLEYIAQEGAFRQDITSNLSPEAARWADERLQTLLDRKSVV